MKKPFPPPGFTILEILVATAISSAIVLLLFGLLTATINMWQHGQNRVLSLTTAQSALERISSELHGAMIKPGQMQFVENSPILSSQGPSIGPAGSRPVQLPVPRIAENVFFITRYPDNQPGDTAAIAYRLSTATTDGEWLFILERAYIPSEIAYRSGTFPVGEAGEAMLSGYPNRYQLASYSNSSPPLFQWRPVAQNIVEFELQCFGRDEVTSGPAEAARHSWNSEDATLAAQGHSPALILVRLCTLDPSVAYRLKNKAPSDTNLQDNIKPPIKEYRIAVSLAVQ